jgi:hypothetical protein
MKIGHVLILGKRWKVRRLCPASFKRLYGADTDAICHLTPDRKIDFRSDKLIITTIRHEVTHAMLSELCIGSAELSREAFEEVVAEMVGEHGPELLSISRRVLKVLA